MNEKNKAIIAEIQGATSDLKADNDKAALKAALRAIDEKFKNSIVGKIAASTPMSVYDRKNDRVGISVNGKVKW